MHLLLRPSCLMQNSLIIIVCVSTTVTCDCLLNFSVHSITFSLMDNSDYATFSLALTCRLRFFHLLLTILCMQSILTGMPSCHKTAYYGQIVAFNVCCTHDGCWLQCFTTTYSINTLVNHVECTTVD